MQHFANYNLSEEQLQFIEENSPFAKWKECDYSHTAGESSSSEKSPGDRCPDCNCMLVVQELCYECPNCHLVFGAADAYCDIICTKKADEMYIPSSRMKVNGPNSRPYQSDFDKTNAATCPQGKKSIYEELKRYNEIFREQGGNPIPNNVLKIVAEDYKKIQEKEVKRGNEKKQIIVCLLQNACLSQGFSRKNKEIAKLMGLSNSKTSRGYDYVRRKNEENEIIEVDSGHLDSYISGAFHNVDMHHLYQSLGPIAKEVVETAKKNNIGTNSELRSRANAAVYEILCRAGYEIDLKKYAEKCGIRDHTLSKFLTNLRQYHSYFRKIYERHGISAVAIEVKKTRKKRKSPQSKTKD